MKLLKPLLLLVVVLGLASAGYMYFIKPNPNQPAVLGASSSLPPATKTLSLGGLKQGMADVFNQDQLSNATSLATEELGALKDRGLALKDHLGVILDNTKSSSDSASPQERALEYGQYLYCQGVIEEWEKKQ